AAPFLDLVRLQAEYEYVVGTYMLADFDIRTIERPDRQRPVEGEFHIAGAGGLHSGSRNLFRYVGGRNYRLRQADIVIGQEHDFEHVARDGIVVDELGDVIDQL